MDSQTNYLQLMEELDWLEQVIHQVIRSYLLHEGHEKRWEEISLPDLSKAKTPYSKRVTKQGLGQNERLAIALSICPQLKPEILDVFFGKNQLYDRSFTEFGGLVNEKHSGFIPTLQTLTFLIGSNDPLKRVESMSLFQGENSLVEKGLIQISNDSENVSILNSTLKIDPTLLDYFVRGEKKEFTLGADFPAQKISTNLEWEEVVLNDKILEQLDDMVSWLQNSDVLMDDWGLKKMLKPGYRALFYGPPGTGKTLTATLLGKATNREVYKVDLSMIVSKYIGETEKNLAKVFDMARDKDWILFFDEADALFGKRTEANSSNDRYANQQTSYLLQKIEDFRGVVILASNLRANMDTAFSRRFQAMINFPMPNENERLRLWENAFSMGCQLEDSIRLEEFAEKYELAGGAVINVLRYCALKTIRKKEKLVSHSDLLQGIKIEYQKMNRTMNS